MNMQNPLAKVRGMGSSRSGIQHWRSQRYTALLLLPLVAWLLWIGTTLAGADYASARSIIAHPFHTGMAILLAGSLFYHIQLGLQVVIEDYVHIHVLEVTMLLFVRLVCIAGFLISAIAALKLALGA